jgi:hypothetical protein
MRRESEFLLGLSFGLLTVLRTHLVVKKDSEAIELIEDEYQTLKNSLDKYFYSKQLEKKDV